MTRPPNDPTRFINYNTHARTSLVRTENSEKTNNNMMTKTFPAFYCEHYTRYIIYVRARVSRRQLVFYVRRRGCTAFRCRRRFYLVDSVVTRRRNGRAVFSTSVRVYSVCSRHEIRFELKTGAARSRLFVWDGVFENKMLRAAR